MYDKLIENINALDKYSLQKFVEMQKREPNTVERNFNIGYSLLRLECLEEALSFFEALGDDIIPNILFARYRTRKDMLGNLITEEIEEESMCGGGHDGDGGCCETMICCTCICLFPNCVGGCFDSTVIGFCDCLKSCFCG